jgi:hypothetical protein
MSNHPAASPVVSSEVSLIMVQFLSWIAERTRTYADVMDAWKTSCPRLSVWEDASLTGLVRLEHTSDGTKTVTLTALGRALLDGVGVSA